MHRSSSTFTRTLGLVQHNGPTKVGCVGTRYTGAPRPGYVAIYAGGDRISQVGERRCSRLSGRCRGACQLRRRKSIATSSGQGVPNALGLAPNAHVLFLTGSARRGPPHCSGKSFNAIATAEVNSIVIRLSDNPRVRMGHGV